MFRSALFTTIVLPCALCAQGAATSSTTGASLASFVEKCGNFKVTAGQVETQFKIAKTTTPDGKQYNVMATDEAGNPVVSDYTFAAMEATGSIGSGATKTTVIARLDGTLSADKKTYGGKYSLTLIPAGGGALTTSRIAVRPDGSLRASFNAGLSYRITCTSATKEPR